jgi:hypothetical protein
MQKTNPDSHRFAQNLRNINERSVQNSRTGVDYLSTTLKNPVIPENSDSNSPKKPVLGFGQNN